MIAFEDESAIQESYNRTSIDSPLDVPEFMFFEFLRSRSVLKVSVQYLAGILGGSEPTIRTLILDKFRLQLGKNSKRIFGIEANCSEQDLENTSGELIDALRKLSNDTDGRHN